MRFKLLLAAMITTIMMAAPAGAQIATPEASDEPVHVVADRLEIDNNIQVAEFTGQVKATQGDVNIDCDTLKVYYDQGKEGENEKPNAADRAASEMGIMDTGGKVRKVEAIGHVKITQQDRVAVGSKATYWAGARKMLLEGKATVWRGKNQLSGEKITVFLDQNRSVVHGKPGKRVSITIAPKASQTGKGGKTKKGGAPKKKSK